MQHAEIRILFAIGGLGRGGSETQLTRLIEHLPQEFHGVGVVLADPTHTALLPHVVDLGVKPYMLSGHRFGRRSVRVAWNLASATRAVRQFRPSVIYAWLEESALYLVPAGRALGIPVVVARRNLSGSATEQDHRVLGAIQRRVERMATVVTANSQAVARGARDRGIPPERIRLVVNGHERLPPLPLPGGDEITIGYLANYRAEKGHAMMIDALGQLVDRPGWRVLFGGRGALGAELRARAAARGIADRVELVAVDDPRDFWARCHLGALLSDHEGSPNALIEAAFAGRPIVATAVGGSPEVIGDGAGLLVAQGDVAGAATAIEQLLADRAALAEMGQRAWDHVACKFTVEAMVGGHLHALHDAYAARGRRW